MIKIDTFYTNNANNISTINIVMQDIFRLKIVLIET